MVSFGDVCFSIQETVLPTKYDYILCGVVSTSTIGSDAITRPLEPQITLRNLCTVPTLLCVDSLGVGKF